MGAHLPPPELPGLPAAAEEPSDPTKTVDLVRNLQRGDAGALNELFRRYQPRLRRVVRIKMGKRLRAYLDADDIVQETCLVALGKLRGFEVRDPASMMQWLTKIAEFQIQSRLGYLQAQKRDPLRERSLESKDPSTDTALGGAVPSPGPSPSQINLRAELEEIVDGCVEDLEPEDQREVILLRDYHGADWEAIRIQLGRPTLEAVRELHRRAQEKLRENLRALGISSPDETRRP